MKYVKPTLIATFVVLVLSTTSVLVFGWFRCIDWVGVARYETVNSNGIGIQECRPTKTFWDFVELLLVPIGLSGGAWILGESQKAIEEKRAQEAKEIEEKRAQEVRAIEEKRAQEASYQKYYEDYLDKVGRILLRFDDSRRLEDHEDAKVLLKALTFTALKNLDSVRKGNVIQFLYEAALIIDGSSVVSLENADLSNIDLQGRFLAGINLSGSDLSNANLKDVFLGGHFKIPDLSEVLPSYLPDLPEDFIPNRGKYMSSNLSRANLKNADMMGAKLDNTDFTDVTWQDANLTGARLVDAKLDIDKVKRNAKTDKTTIFQDDSSNSA